MRGREARACEGRNMDGIVVTDRTLRHRYEKVSGFCRGTDTSNLHKMAVWSDVSPWWSFVEMRMLSLC